MRFTTLKNEPNLGKVWNDDRTVCYGMYGQVGTLLDKGILVEIDETSRDNWIFISANEEQGECSPQPSKEALKGFLQLRLVEKGSE